MNSANKKYVDFYFYACLDELFAVENSTWKTKLNGNEIVELAEFLNIGINKEHIIKTYWDESKQTIEIYHSQDEDLEFLYFDLRRMITDQSDMFFLGVRCERERKKEVMNKLIPIYDLLKTTGSFSYEKWGWKLYTLQKRYLVLKGDYEEEGTIIHHRK